jgi:hypothetical protein
LGIAKETGYRYSTKEYLKLGTYPNKAMNGSHAGERANTWTQALLKGNASLVCSEWNRRRTG